MPRYNIFIPDHQVEQWEDLDSKSKYVQEKLDEDYPEWVEQKAEAVNAQGN